MTHSARWDHGHALGRLARSPCFERRELAACLREITETAVATLGVAQCGAWFYSEEGDALMCADLFAGDSAGHAEGSVLRASEFPAYFGALSTERAIAAENVETDPRTAELARAHLSQKSVRALVNAPIIYKGQMVGALSCEHVGGPRAWRAEEELFVASLADFIALAMALDEGRRAEEWRHDADRRYRDLFENATEGIFQITSTGRFFAVNPAMARLLGYPTAEALIGSHRNDASSLFLSPRHWDELAQLVQTTDRVTDHEVELMRQGGGAVWVSLSVRAVRRADGTLRYFQGTVEDVTHRKRAEAQLTHLSFHDGLTNLPNRTLLSDRIEQALRRTRAGKSSGTALLIIDCDDFQLINNSLGHALGDRLLMEVARRLEAALRPGDTLSRIGSDDFAVLAEGITSAADALAMGEALRQAVSLPCQLGEQEVFPSVSAGIVLDTGERIEAEALLRDAGIALEQARAQGRGRCLLFQEPMRTAPIETLRLHSELRRAVERGELELRYQPVVDLSDHSLLGFEALLRWHHPERGMIPPIAFIPIAEQQGLIRPLGNWILRTACQRLRHWQALGGLRAPTLSVNVSPVELLAHDLLETVDAAVAEAGIDVGRLSLEITETALADDVDMVSQRLEALHQRGFRILIDDFGTGYSSLSRLHRFPIDGLKVDQSFVKPMLFDEDSASIVRTVAALGRALEVDVIAEGVEDQATAQALARLKCGQAQGFHFALPLTSDEADALVRRAAAGKVTLPL